MKYTSFDIINRNLAKLEFAKSNFPILAKYEKAITEFKTQSKLGSYTQSQQIYTNLDIDKISKEAGNFELSQYIAFIDWIVNRNLSGQKIIYTDKISFMELKEVMINSCIDSSVKTWIKNRSKRQFDALLNNEKAGRRNEPNEKLKTDLFRKYSGDHMSRTKGSKFYSRNFAMSDAILTNYIIQNDIEIADYERIGLYYYTEIKNVDLTLKTEVQLTNEIVNLFLNKSKDMDLDFRKINLSNFISLIDTEIRSRILSVRSGEKIKCIGESVDKSGLTVDKFYDVKNFRMYSGKLMVTVRNDDGRDIEYNYRLFESVAETRNNYLDLLLNE